MPRARKKKAINPWTPADIKNLRSVAGKHPARVIAKTVKRSEGAVRQKALALKISLRVRSRAKQ
jgi:hypothetical protein